MAINIKKAESAAPQVKMPNTPTYIDHLKDDKPIVKPPVATGTVNIVSKKITEPGGEMVETKQDEEFVIKDAKFGDPIPLYALINLNVGGKRTLALENYGGKKFETAQIHASVTVPCHLGNMEQAWEFASDWVSEKLMASVKAATGSK